MVMVCPLRPRCARPPLPEGRGKGSAPAGAAGRCTPRVLASRRALGRLCTREAGASRACGRGGAMHPKGTCFAASTGPPLHKGQGLPAPAGAAGRSVEVRRVTGEVQNGRGQNAPSCTAVFALSALFVEKRVHITTVEKGVETVQNPLRKGLGAVAQHYFL